MTKEKMKRGQMVDRVKSVYPSIVWARKVDQMTDKQIKTLFVRLRREGKLEGES